MAQDGTGDFTSIRNAIDSVSGSTIVVEGGTYDTEAELGSYGNNVVGLQIGSQDAGTDPASAPLKGLRIVGRDQPIIDGWVQILDPDITFEGFEVTGEVFGYGLAAFEPDVTIRDVTVSGVTNGLFVPSIKNVTIEGCTVENYSFYGAVVSGRGEEFGGATATVLDTTFDGASGGGAVGIGIVETAAEIRENTVSGNESTGDGAGIAHFGGASADVQENIIESNDDGIFFAGAADAESSTATRNDIVNNLVGVANEASSEVDATGNWWGSADGPGAAASTNEDEPEGSVDDDPWSTAPGPNWNTAGSPSAFSASSIETGGSDEQWEGPMPPSNPDPAN